VQGLRNSVKEESARTARDDVPIERNGPVTTVIIDRPQARKACRVETVKALHDAFMAFEADGEALPAAVLWQGWIA
jgi:enoyl-CoA hydratase